MNQVTIYVGSTYGSTVKLAQHCASRLKQQGLKVQLVERPTEAEIQADGSDCWLIFSASIGMGQVPSNLRALPNLLEQAEQTVRPRGYALVAIGDSGFKDFAGAGETLVRLLDQRGFEPIIEPLTLDVACQTKTDQLLDTWLECCRSSLLAIASKNA